ncbi:hypothetical protein RMSM_07529 [Rhodopirellula maiorica SM1]|uniref:Uncharacterized protein n=1 Tax=Rhodopirellula maiorica SM1 TaxID=1265738 RepID=M5R835_9BACT|nr:hypothetical protein RMSM_07529 [Rhodopirellula maiorica SM1]
MPINAFLAEALPNLAIFLTVVVAAVLSIEAEAIVVRFLRHRQIGRGEP